MNRVLGDKNPFTSLVVRRNTTDKNYKIDWILDTSVIDFKCSEFLVRRSPDTYNNIKIVARDIKPLQSKTEYSILDENAIVTSRERTFYYQVILRNKSKAYYSGWTAPSGRHPLRFGLLEEGLIIDVPMFNDAELENCFLLDLGSILNVVEEQRTRLQVDE